MLKQYIAEDTLKERTCELFGRHAVFLNNPRLCRFDLLSGLRFCIIISCTVDDCISFLSLSIKKMLNDKLKTVHSNIFKGVLFIYIIRLPVFQAVLYFLSLSADIIFTVVSVNVISLLFSNN